MNDERILPLDGLRGVAALIVVVWHLTGSMFTAEWGAFTGLIYSATIFGRTGVDLFFALSGFLIIGIIVDQRGAANLFSVFYIRRACRILPPYLALIGVYWLCVAAFGESEAFNTSPNWWTHLLAQLTFTYNWLMSSVNGPVARGFSVTWSVAIEEWFYLFAPALLLLTPRRHLWLMLLAIGLGSAAGRAIYHLMRPDMVLAPYILPQYRLDGLCFGGLAALALRNVHVRVLFSRWGEWFQAVALMMAVSVPFIIAAIKNNLIFHMYLWCHFYLAVAFAWLVLCIAMNPVRYRGLAMNILRLAGRISYSLYLFHPLFLSLFFVLAGRREAIATWSDVGLTAASLLATLLFCFVLYELVEKRAIRLGHAFRYRLGEPNVASVYTRASS